MIRAKIYLLSARIFDFPFFIVFGLFSFFFCSSFCLGAVDEFGDNQKTEEWKDICGNHRRRDEIYSL